MTLKPPSSLLLPGKFWSGRGSAPPTLMNNVGLVHKLPYLSVRTTRPGSTTSTSSRGRKGASKRHSGFSSRKNPRAPPYFAGAADLDNSISL